MNYSHIELNFNRIRLLDRKGMVIKTFTQKETLKFIEEGLYRIYGWKKVD